jgi:hypothetical protein
MNSHDHLGKTVKAQWHLLISWLIYIMLSCSLPGWHVTVLHTQLECKYLVCSDFTHVCSVHCGTPLSAKCN